MTKAKANDPGDPIIFIWLLPDVVAFKSEGSKVSKLFLMRACAVMVRVVAQLRHQESAPEGKRLKKRDVGNIATELFSDAAEEIPLTTQAQTHRADVALAPSGDGAVNAWISPLVTQAELERATRFMLHAAFRAMLEARVVLKPNEFLCWLIELSSDTAVGVVAPSESPE